MTHPTMPVSMLRYVGVGSQGDARLKYIYTSRASSHCGQIPVHENQLLGNC